MDKDFRSFDSPEARKQFYDQYSRDPAIVNMERDKVMLIHQNRYMDAMALSEKIQQKMENEFQAWRRRMIYECNHIDIANSGLEEDIVKRINLLYITVFMACDIIEFSVLDMNDILKSAGSGIKVKIFDDIISLSDLAKKKLEYFEKNSEMPALPKWGDRCDDMYRLMKNKAGKVIRECDTEKTIDYGNDNDN